MPDLILRPPLPFRSRARLRLERCIDHLGARLVERGHIAAAERMWRACRLL
ncbi:hypothetical protein IHE56_00950 [Streptomyces sp. ID01-12c]|nr:hypothetical protein [Streptomyces caniscabiei]